MNRRDMLRVIAAAALSSNAIAAPSSHAVLSLDDERFLEDMERRGCLFFAEQAGQESGQVLDRALAQNPDGVRDPRRMASIAATGFGLAALCIAEHRGYQAREKVIAQVRRTLDFHCNRLPHDHGFFAHFNDVDSGEPWRDSEISSIDTALLLCGVLTARAHFRNEPEIVRLATTIYERVEWTWMLNGGTAFSMGVRHGKFLDATWSHYCELMMLYLLAIGSPTHPVPAECWNAFSRPVMKFGPYSYISAKDPLFVHQYSHAYFDFRNKRDAFANYFANSITATKAHKAFCLSLGKLYADDYWGISASDSQHGYTAWGGPPAIGDIDGSVVPNATAGSLAFVPGECLRVQRSLLARYGEKAWGRYGFCDAFHPTANWYDPDVLGIDLGISVLMAENLRSGFVWDTFQRNPEAAAAMKKVGFRPAWS